MDVRFQSTSCGQCSGVVSVITRGGRLLMSCTGGHEWPVDFGSLLWLVDDREKYESLINSTIAKQLDDNYIPSCFGNMPTMQHIPLMGTPTDYSSPEAAFLSVINAKINDAKMKASQLKLCTKCELFDRCNVISGRREC